MGQSISGCLNICKNLRAVDAMTYGAQRHICSLVSGIVWVYLGPIALIVEQRRADLER